jgi:transcriptional regulator with XRE-family HTH domain
VTFGQRLLRLRRLGESRAQVAASIQISAEHLRNIETDNSRPSSEVLSRLLDLYDLSEASRVRLWVAFADTYIPSGARAFVKVVPRSTETT